ncbi:MAG TPA: hypothetical protein VHU19_16305 [Pyrinomonadaceae bacterium]|jgi:hypothetical protein|nr:hypothetical protein [Pyrinomonadaceae bacterium]
MSHRSKILKLAAVALIFFSLVTPALAAQDKKERKSTPGGTPVLWRAPDDLPARDLYLGPGGERMKPDLSSLTFESDETGGYSVKWQVRDGAGKKWTAKLGREAQAETAAVRLMWAVGYMTEVNYLVPCVHIVNAPKPRKEVERCEGDGFRNVRLKSRPVGEKNIGNWSWKQNPFFRTKEFGGLLVMMALLNNWDLKEENNKIFYVPSGDGGRGELLYTVTDLGASFGQVKVNAPVLWRILRNRNDPQDYARDPFLEDVKGGRVYFFYTGKQADLFDDIGVDEARWIGNLLSKLSNRQLGDAFRAANYTPEEVRLLSGAVRARINELAGVGGPTAAR